MIGLDLNQPVRYLHASLRYFEPKESHVTRFCADDVLLMVFEGTLHFTEDGVPHDVAAGEYFIQKKESRQSALRPSDSPKYFYVHFLGAWEEEGDVLPRRGTFSPEEMMPLMERLDQENSRNRSLIEKSALFYQILSGLYQRKSPGGPGGEIAAYLRKHACDNVSLEELASRFSYSKNQIINLIKEGYGKTPLEYQHSYRLKHGEWLLRVTSVPLARVAEECGYGEYSQFYKEFVRAYGVPPQQWRGGYRK